MKLARALCILLAIWLVAACSEPAPRTFPSNDDAGVEAPVDFPLGASPETLVA